MKVAPACVTPPKKSIISSAPRCFQGSHDIIYNQIKRKHNQSVAVLCISECVPASVYQEGQKDKILTYAWGIALLHATALAHGTYDQSQARLAGAGRACETLGAGTLQNIRIVSYRVHLAFLVCHRITSAVGAMPSRLGVDGDIRMVHHPYSPHNKCRRGIER